MSSAVVKIISPILINSEWVRSGEVTLPTAEAMAQDAAGLVDIVRIDGVAVVWGACCSSQEHDH